MVAISATMPKMRSLFMAVLSGSAGTISIDSHWRVEQLYLTVDEVQLRMTTKFDIVWPAGNTDKTTW
jgi:hypothetical protein